jgi:hypothetical protein
MDFCAIIHTFVKIFFNQAISEKTVVLCVFFINY